MLPVVRFFFACDSCVCDLADYKWSIRNPWHTVQMPRGRIRGHGQKELWLYAQLAGAIGEYELGVELRYYDPTRMGGLVLGRSGAERRTFSHKLEVQEIVFQMVKVPFPRSGQYEFRLVARGRELENGTTFLDVYSG